MQVLGFVRQLHSCRVGGGALCALASVRRPNCTCGFPACSFHVDALREAAIEGINPIKFTSPYSPYSTRAGSPSLTAGSLMEHTKLPLSTWFLAIYLISQAKTGLSSLARKRQLGVSYPTAWLLQQKISRAMGQQDRTHRLSGEVQIDDAYLGGERAGGKVGRGSENKVPFVAAVSVNEAGHPLHLKLCVLSGFSSQALGKWAKANLTPGAVVSSDGLGCFAAVTGAGCLHLPTVVGTLKPRDLPQFKWINTVLGNLKTTLTGAHHAMKYRKYAEHYLAAFAYRFNRRFDLRGLVARLVVDVARSKPVAEKVVRAHAEARF